MTDSNEPQPTQPDGTEVEVPETVEAVETVDEVQADEPISTQPAEETAPMQSEQPEQPEHEAGGRKPVASLRWCGHLQAGLGSGRRR